MRSLCAKAVNPRPGWPNVPSVAAVCVYPNLVPVAKQALSGTSVKVASVATAFPSGLSSLEVKLADTAAALESGALTAVYAFVYLLFRSRFGGTPTRIERYA